MASKPSCTNTVLVALAAATQTCGIGFIGWFARPQGLITMYIVHNLKERHSKAGCNTVPILVAIH